MTTLDFSHIELKKIITHHIGNKSRDEQLVLSSEETALEEQTKDLITKYFTGSLNAEEFYSFSQSDSTDVNEISTIASEIFANPDSFIEQSKEIARLLFEQSSHPKIKDGELSLALFSNMIVDNVRVDALGVFKSETTLPYIKLSQGKMNFTMIGDSGFDGRAADKGCLIFNGDQAMGFRLIVDGSHSGEARYWRDDFLKITPVQDAFHQTAQAIKVTSGFIKDLLPEEFEINKADQIDLINRSLNYFKKNETFVKKDFEETILQDPEVIKSFRSFEQGFRNENNLEPIDEFDISRNALKKQTRFLKSVLKLDKNFHIYIHGNRELIQQGTEGNGRKFYKIYFDKES
jgi:hypothetical protein